MEGGRIGSWEAIRKEVKKMGSWEDWKVKGQR